MFLDNLANAVRDYKRTVTPGERIEPVHVVVLQHSPGVYYWYVRYNIGLRTLTGDECDQIVLECSLDPMLKMSSLVSKYRASNP